MSNAVTICNLALSHLGDTATVASIQPPEGSVQAEHCARFYPQALRSLLALHHWGFATRYEPLQRVDRDGDARFAYVFALPAEALEMVAVHDAYGVRMPFAVQGRHVLANQPLVWGQWIDGAVEPNSFPPLFTETLAWQLASMLAGPILKGDAGAAEAKRCLQMVSVYLPQAKEADANQYQLPITHKVVWMEQR